MENAFLGIAEAPTKIGVMNAYPGRGQSPVIAYCRFNMCSSHLEPILNGSSGKKCPYKNLIKIQNFPDIKHYLEFSNFSESPVISSYNTRFKKRGSAKWKKNRGIKGKNFLCFFVLLAGFDIPNYRKGCYQFLYIIIYHFRL